MKKLFPCVGFFLCLLAGPAMGGNEPRTAKPTVAQAEAVLGELTGRLSEALCLGPEQQRVLQRYAAQELKLFVALRPVLNVAAPRAAQVAPASFLDDTLYLALSPQQFADFKALKRQPAMARLLQSPVFVR